MVLEASDRQFWSAFTHAAIGMALFAPDGRFLKVNPALARMLGYAQPDLEALSHQDIAHPDERIDEDRLARLLQGEIDSFQVEKRYRHREGRFLWVRLSVSVARGDNGEPLHQIAQFDDISESRERQREVQRLSRLYAALSQVNQAIVLTRTREALFAKVCEALVHHGGFQIAWIGWRETEGGRLVPVSVAGDDRDYVKNLTIFTDDRPEGRGPAGTAVRENRPYICNDLLNDPATLPWRTEIEKHTIRSAAVFPIRLKDQPCGALSVYADETGFFQGPEIALLAEASSDLSFGLEGLAREEERRRAEAARRASDERYHTLFDQAPVGIVIANANSTYLDGNPAICRMLGYARDEFIGKNAADIVVPEEVSHIEPALGAITGRSAYHREWMFRRKDGSVFPAEVTATQMPDGNMLGMISDITERKQAEAALREMNVSLERKVESRTEQLSAALSRAEAADRIKSAFLATMSHELRTPLNSIIGFTGILLQGLAGPLNDEQTKQMGMVKVSARHLLDLITDVLDISKIEAGQLDVRSESFDIHTSIQNTVASVRPMAEKKGLELTADIDASLAHLVSDRRRVEQILLNLINNAVKFTDRGTVKVLAERLPATAGQEGPNLRIVVKDTGIGIARGDLEKLFQPFRQVDSGLTRLHEGTGLGLAICRRLAELLGGHITVTSRISQGTEFTVILPLERPPRA